MTENKLPNTSVKTINQYLMSPDLYTGLGSVYNYNLHPKHVEFLQYYFSLPIVVDFVERLWDLPDDQKVLDLGSGIGAESVVLKENVPRCQIISVDMSTTGTQYSKSEFNNDQVQADIRVLPFNDGTFAAIHCKDVLAHIEAKDDFLTEVCRILKPGGLLLLVSGLTTYGSIGQFEWNPSDLIDSAKKANFSLVSSDLIQLTIDDWYAVKNARNFFLFVKNN